MGHTISKVHKLTKLYKVMRVHKVPKVHKVTEDFKVTRTQLVIYMVKIYQGYGTPVYRLLIYFFDLVSLPKAEAGVPNI